MEMWAAVFVYEEVPVDPAVHAGVQVSDHIVCIICGVKVIDVLWCLEVHRSVAAVVDAVEKADADIPVCRNPFEIALHGALPFLVFSCIQTKRV